MSASSPLWGDDFAGRTGRFSGLVIRIRSFFGEIHRLFLLTPASKAPLAALTLIPRSVSVFLGHGVAESIAKLGLVELPVLHRLVFL
jgi:hypothetical protein